MGRDHSLSQERAGGVQMFFSFGFELKRDARNRGIRVLRSIPRRVLQDSARRLRVLRKSHGHNVPAVNFRFVQALVRDSEQLFGC